MSHTDVGCFTLKSAILYDVILSQIENKGCTEVIMSKSDKKDFN